MKSSNISTAIKTEIGIINGSELSYDSLENVIGKNKVVEKDGYWIQTARSIDMCLGD